eukprot:4478229-Amphidinium_carterae.1
MATPPMKTCILDLSVILGSSSLCTKDKVWALYDNKGGGNKAGLAADDKCEECWQLWSESFGYLTWADMCARNRNDEHFSKLLSEARGVKAGKLPKPSKAETVDAETKITMFVDKTFQVATERQMKRVTGLSRIPKMHLKNLAKVNMPTEDGDAEECYYCFKDVEEPMQTVTVRVEVGSSMKTSHLPKDFFLYAGQGKSMQEHVMKEVADVHGMTSLVDKDVYLPTFDDFCEKKLSKKDGTDGEQETEPLQEALELETQYSGAAAASLIVQKPQGKKAQ